MVISTQCLQFIRHGQDLHENIGKVREKFRSGMKSKLYKISTKLDSLC